jgi:hypothetical protein
MLPATEHTSSYSYSLFWSKDPADVIVAVIMGGLGLWGGYSLKCGPHFCGYSVHFILRSIMEHLGQPCDGFLALGESLDLTVQNHAAIQ